PAVGNTNNGSVNWAYSIADASLDFLAAGQTLLVNSTVTISDGHVNGTDTAQVYVTITGAEDAPVVTAADKIETANFSEFANTTNALPSVTDPLPPASGTIHFTDADLNDRPTPSISTQSVKWIAADGVTDLSASLTPAQITALEQALIVTPAAGNTNNGSV